MEIITIEENKQEINCNLNMNRVNKKNAVRLTESDLHRIIRESVNNILTELDWKTYANAARKRALQGSSRQKINDLDDAANKALFDKYKTKEANGIVHRPQIHTKNSPYDGYGQIGRFPELGAVTDFRDTYYRPLDDEEESWYTESGFDDTDRQDDMRNYFSNNYEYSNDKGWHLKNESINRIIRESVNRVLRNL